MIECVDLHYTYGDNEILRGISLEVSPGEIVALLGRSGSGKSTLLYCLAGVLIPSRGGVSLGGENLSAMSDKQRTRVRAQKCGFVLQFGRLVGELTAVENVSVPLRLAGWSRKDAERKARTALRELCVNQLSDRKAASLSGGEQQRVAVVRALIHRPAVVFADEPTGALDSANGMMVLDRLTELSRASGTAMVLVTHEEVVAAQADRQVRISDGVLEVGAAVVR